MKCPKKYYSFDVSNRDCEKCGQGLLYKTCDICKKKNACSGWADKIEVYCCTCYTVKYEKEVL